MMEKGGLSCLEKKVPITHIAESITDRTNEGDKSPLHLR